MPSHASLSRGLPRAQRGAALIALLAVIMLGSAWMLTTRLNEGSASFTAQNRIRNAEVLNRAKLALIGYVAQKAVTDNNPGRLPCPEAVSIIGTSSEGSSAPWVPTPSTSTCASIGRLPWRTLGLEKLVDAAGEPLWYVVGPTWRLTTNTSTLKINSNTAGGVQVDGQQVVALIIAPGTAMNAQSITGTVCTAHNQVRRTPAPAMDPPMDARDYLECFDSEALQFITTAASTSFNDQVVRITTDDVLPAIEAAVARRVESEIVPVLKTFYADATKWGTSTDPEKPVFPFPAPFGDPSASNYQGQAGLYQGLVPFNYSTGCDPLTDARCTTTLIAWVTPTVAKSGGSASLWPATTCSSSGATSTCTGWYEVGSINLAFDDRASNVAMALRTFDESGHTANTVRVWDYDLGMWRTGTAALTRNFNGNGSLSFALAASMPSVTGWGYFQIVAGRPTISDHPLLNSTNPTTGWFVRNEWYRLLYYAIAQGHAPGGSLSCISGGTGSTGCLQVTNLADPTKQQAILVLAGRALTTTTPSQSRLTDVLRSDLQNYLDSAENQDGNTTFIQSTVSRSFNDRIVSLSKNP